MQTSKSNDNPSPSSEIGVTLYAVTKTGNVKTWRCEVTPLQDGSAELSIITQTKLDGKEVIRRDVIMQGKNLGRSNETTPYEQALSEATSRMNKKRDQGYKTEIPTDTSRAGTNALGFIKPMLAKPIDKVKKVTFPAHWQPKLDGHRAIVTREGGKMLMYSRQGKLITSMDHILDYLEPHFKEGTTVDGELYVHGEMLQNIGSLIRRKQEESERVMLYLYDLVCDMPYSCRLVELTDLLSCYEDYGRGPVRLLDTLRVDSMQHAQTLTERVIEQGYEGGILRLEGEGWEKGGGYEAGFRSNYLLKIKNFDDSEHTIVDVIEGKDRIVNDTHLKVAVFLCVTPKGKEFECTAFGDQYEKDRIWHNREDFIGKVITVKHSGYTKEGKPWHPVALRLREDI